jgi:hypothetical protein
MAHRVRSSRRRPAAAAWAFAVFAFAAVAALAGGVALNQRGQVSAPVIADAAPASEAIPPPVAPLDAALPADAQRAVFPYSVVPGGVDSVDALRKAIAADPVVAAHYKSFDLSKARVERLETPRVAHVSYRIGGNVYWTRKPLVLPAGERVITDGTHIARTRCANQVDDLPGATSPAEPKASVLDTPVASGPLPAWSAAAFSTPVRTSGITPTLVGGAARGSGGASGSGGGSSGSGGGSSGSGGGSSGIGGGTPGAVAPSTSSSSSSSSDSHLTPAKVDFNPCAVGSTACSPQGSGADSDSGGPANPPGGSAPPSFGSNPPSGPPEGPGDHPLGPPDPPGGPGAPGDPKDPGKPTDNVPPFDPPGGGPNPPGDGLNPPGNGPTPPGDGLTPPGDGLTPPGDGPNPPGDGPTPPGDGPTPPRQEGPATIPEPASLLLMLTGASGLLARRLSARRRG